MGFGAEEAGAEDDVGAAIEDGPQKLGVFGGIVFEVGVLDDDDSAWASAMPVRSAAPLPWLTWCWNRRMRRGFRDFLQSAPSIIGGTVVDDDELEDLGLVEHALDNARDGGTLVVDGHNDGQAARGVDDGLDHGSVGGGESNV